ncbi:epidermal growth factor-like protein 7 [Astyanax mexicanus]|uniref:Epidermal growth factor-like protein 7 n=1 Tax=Astyanax mexicanus TaxID=7994 RepID=A0A8T2L2P1_ASTMX|nr:epidermal growth factor-like protein 7 [Astyanax mexicanus]
MYCAVLLSSVLFSLHASCTPQFYGHHGRRVCVGSAGSSRVVTSTESFIQPVHTPYITMCPTHRICSTYKTVYKVSYRQVTRSVPISSFYSECCPGWRRLHSHNCNQALCVQECTNGGSCIRPNHCACPLGWTGRYCQIDVDECKGSHGCTQQCLNSAGSYRCACSDGFRLTEDGRTCRSNPTPSPPPPTTSSDAGGGGLVENVTEEVQILRNRVELLEQKLEMVLAPFSTLFPPEEGDKNGYLFDRTNFLSDETNFLSHSLRQLDRIDSLSEQVGFLEERLGTCSCQEN